MWNVGLTVGFTKGRIGKGGNEMFNDLEDLSQENLEDLSILEEFGY